MWFFVAFCVRAKRIASLITGGDKGVENMKKTS